MRDSTGRPRRLAVLVVVMAVLALVGEPAGRAQGAPGQGATGQQPARAGFLEPFDGRPDQPTPWHAPNWDVTIHSRDRETWDQLEPMAAQHGGNCSAPPDAHVINSYDDVVFQCNNHMMTAINASGYGLIYLTPNQQVDFSGGEAVIRFDLSTLRSSTRDWVDIWITPFEDQVQLPLDSWLPDLTGEPQRSVHVRMKDSGGKTSFSANVFRGNQMEELEGSWWLGYEDFLTPSAVRRDPFEIRISRTSLKVGMPDYNQWWVNSKMADLGWDRAVVQFGHHSYTPSKDCNGCGPNTWHWDNIGIEPAVPFTIIPGDRRLASEERGATV
ncbi:MAG: hypothetical protein AB7P40_21555, partial [Chloroflexota bacterium]